MSHYADYVKERENFQTLETRQGFATYIIEGSCCYIRDIYVVPEARKSRVGSLLADCIAEIAKKEGCTMLVGSVCPATNNATNSLKALLAYGFQLASVDYQKNLIMFSKGI